MKRHKNGTKTFREETLAEMRATMRNTASKLSQQKKIYEEEKRRRGQAE